MKWIRTLLWMAAFFFAIHFSVQNRDEVTLRYSVQSIQWFQISRVPLFLVILCSIFLGVLMGGVADLYRYFKLKRTLRENQRTVERLEQEVRSLRPSGNDRASFVE
jgi:uncharacterized integral membrane protein